MLISDITPPKTRKKEKPKRRLYLKVLSVLLITFLVIELLITLLASTPPGRVEAISSWLEGYDYRTSIYVKGSTTELTNYQVKLTIQGNNKQEPNYIDFQKVGYKGKDVRFTDQDRVTKIPHWIQSWDDNNKTSTIWIKIPTIPTTGITIYMYYGKADDISESDGQDTFELYNVQDVKALWHMDEQYWNGTSGEVKDETGTNNGTAKGGPTTTSSGKQNRAGIFDGLNDYVRVANSPSLNITDTISLETWVKGQEAVFSKVQRTISSRSKVAPKFQVVGTKIYYVWAESDGSNTQIWTATMNTNGTGWSATKRTTSAYHKFEPQLQVVGTKIYYVWREADGAGGFQIWTGEMDTDGTDWDADQRTNGPYVRNYPQFQVVGTKIYYVWAERDDSNFWQIWTADMNTNGSDWDAAKRTDSTYEKQRPQLQVEGTKIYYVWQEKSFFPFTFNQIWTADMNTNGSDWSAAERTASSYQKVFPQLQVVDTKIYYTWQEHDGFYNQIWTGEMNTNRTGWEATQRTTSSYQKIKPRLQVEGTKIYYVWYENDGSNSQIWTAEMNTNKTGWNEDQRTTSAHNKIYPRLQVVDTKIYYVWQEADGTVQQIWTAEMNTNKTGWDATQRTFNSYDKEYPQLQVVGSKIYYVWKEKDDSNYYQIWTGEMNTNGTGWSATKRTTSAYDKDQPQLQVVGSNIYYVWQESDGSNYQIWTAKMDTIGSGWDAQQMTTSAYDKQLPQLQVVGTEIYYVWVESDGANYQIWTAKMNTNGSGWDDDQRTTSAYDKRYPQLQVVGTEIYYTWTESDGANYQIWTADMNTNGSGWDDDQRTTSAYEKYVPQLQVVGTKIYYTWTEYDGANYQIWTADMNTNGSDWSAAERTTSSHDTYLAYLQVVGTKIYYVWYEADSINWQIWTAETYTNLLNKGDFYGLGLVDGKVRGFINAGVDSLKYKAEAVSDTAGAIVEAGIDTNWNHVVLTYDGSSLKLYVNGNLEVTTPYTASIRTNDLPLALGDDLNGKLDEVKIYSNLLEQDKISTLHDNYLQKMGSYYNITKYTDIEPTLDTRYPWGYKKIFKDVTNRIFVDGPIRYSIDPELSDELINFSVMPSKDSIDLTVFYWFRSDTYYKKWKESSDTKDITTTHVVGALAPNTSYPVKVDGVLFGRYISNSSGQISFVYDLGYSDKIFEVGEPPDLTPTGNNISNLIYLLPTIFFLIGFTLYFKLSLSRNCLKRERE